MCEPFITLGVAAAILIVVAGVACLATRPRLGPQAQAIVDLLHGPGWESRGDALAHAKTHVYVQPGKAIHYGINTTLRADLTRGENRTIDRVARRLLARSNREARDKRLPKFLEHLQAVRNPAPEAPVSRVASVGNLGTLLPNPMPFLPPGPIRFVYKV